MVIHPQLYQYLIGI